MPASARFCLSCGAPLEAIAEVEIRKTVSLLFCDVTGSTAMGEELDPEALRSVMPRYFAVARRAVERHTRVASRLD
jgi:class 3 adenylate cyclase